MCSTRVGPSKSVKRSGISCQSPVAPALDEMVLERLELVPVSTERLLLVFNLRSGGVRTIFVEVPGRVRAAATGTAM